MRVAVLLGVVGIDGGVASAILESVGKMGSMLTPFLPPEVRGLTTSASSVLLADANRKKGLIDFVPDGSDYGWICLCPTKYQMDYLVKSGFQALPDKCTEDAKMGCRLPQIDMTEAPLPKAQAKK